MIRKQILHYVSQIQKVEKYRRKNSFSHLLDTARSRRKTSTYIVKPDCGSQGEGIYLVNDPRDVQDVIGAKPAVVQV